MVSQAKNVWALVYTLQNSVNGTVCLGILMYKIYLAARKYWKKWKKKSFPLLSLYIIYLCCSGIQGHYKVNSASFYSFTVFPLYWLLTKRKTVTATLIAVNNFELFQSIKLNPLDWVWMCFTSSFKFDWFSNWLSIDWVWSSLLDYTRNIVNPLRYIYQS